MNFGKYSSIALLVIVFSSCVDNKRKEYEEVLNEWVGKEILFPNTMRTTDSVIWNKEESDFTILSYYDSVGCTGCKMKLQEWSRLVNKIDSLNPEKKVDVIVVANSTRYGEMAHLKRYNGYRNTLVVDSEDALNRLNHFLDNPELQCYLLDSNNKVIAIGNPITNNKVRRLYLSVIGETELADTEDDDNDPYMEYDFGRIDRGKTVLHEFDLRNKSQETLRVKDVITSCECVSADVTTRVISPQKDYKLIVSFSDTISGEFMRSVTVTFENENPDLYFEISGEIN